MGRRRDIDGRQLLLDAALRLFATQGVEGVSIRAVNREAGLGPASVHYHFGTKEALLDAVLSVHGDIVEKQFKDRAQEIARGEAPTTPHDLVLMLAQPYLDVMASDRRAGHDWVRLVSQQLQTHPGSILDSSFTKLARGAVARVFPEANANDVARAMRMCLTLLVTQLAQMGRPSRPSAASVDLDLLLDFLSGGLEATLGSQPGAASGSESRRGRRRQPA
jgi:AcrR family transcriptional regulator